MFCGRDHRYVDTCKGQTIYEIHDPKADLAKIQIESYWSDPDQIPLNTE